MSMLTFLPSESNPVFFTENFRNVLETYVPTLRMSRESYTVKVDPADSIKYKGDLDGYLYSLSIPSFMHWITCRVNGMKSSLDFNPDYEYIIIPNQVELEQIRQIYMTTSQ